MDIVTLFTIIKNNSWATTFALTSTGIASLDNGLNVIKNISMGIIAGIGVVVLAFGLFEFATSFFQHDTAQTPVAIKKIVSGIIMIAIGAIIILFV